MRIVAVPAIGVRKTVKDFRPCCLISIASTEKERLQAGLSEVVCPTLLLTFDDLTPQMAATCSLHFCQYNLRVCSKQDVEKILAFVESFHGENVVIHCSAGVSRSVGVAYALILKYQGNSAASVFLQEHGKLTEQAIYIAGLFSLEKSA